MINLQERVVFKRSYEASRSPQVQLLLHLLVRTHSAVHTYIPEHTSFKL